MVAEELSTGHRIPRRELALWLAGLLFARYLVEIANAIAVSHVSTVVNVFQFLAWYATFRLLAGSADDRPAAAWEFAAFALIAVVCALPGVNAVWIGMSLAALLLLLVPSTDFGWRRAGTVLAAFATNGLWGPLLFKYVGSAILQFDAALVAQVLEHSGQLRQFNDNIVTTSAGGVTIFEQCSSFHNLSLALLCWVTFTKLSRPSWRGSDFVVAAICTLLVLSWNTLRLYLPAVAPDQISFAYWHGGIGAKLLSTALGFTVAFVCAYGANLPSESPAEVAI